MEKFYQWNSDDANALVSIMSVTLGFSTYWFLSQSPKLKNWVFNKYTGDKAWIIYVSLQRIVGMILMGILPGCCVLYFTDYTLSELGMKLGNLNITIFYLLIFGPILSALCFFNSKNSANREIYPQMRFEKWTVKMHLINAIGWAGYLVMYEFMFRGLLLFVCVDAFGFWLAVAINVAYYSATHIAKGIGETIGTFPYGMLLCFVTMASGSIAFALISHLIMALSNDFFSLRHKGEA